MSEHLLIQVLDDGEEWLMNRILHYAKKHQFTKYTSTLQEAWRLSIQGLTQSIVEQVTLNSDCLELTSDDSFESDALTSFGVEEARLHRRRGVTLSMFLGLMKYYRQSYLDLLHEKYSDQGRFDADSYLIGRCFDRIEIAFCDEWSKVNDEARYRELQENNRYMTNEKNAYLTFFESLPDPIIILGWNNEIISLNHAAARLIDHTVPGGDYYGQPHDSCIGRQVDSVFTWLKQALKQLKEGSHGEEITVEMTWKEQPAYFNVRWAKLLDVSEKFTGSTLLLQDVTRLKQSRQAVQELSELNEAIVRFSSVGLAVYSEDGQCVQANQAAAAIIGATAEDVLQQNFKTIDSWQASGLTEQAEQCLLTGEAVEKEIHLVTSYQKEVFLFCRFVRFMQDRKPQLLLIIEDVTEKKKNERLLLEARDKAESANRAKSAFLANMSHEIRTPMHAILGFTEILEQRVNQPDLSQHLKTIETSGKALMSLINDILDLSKIESGKSTVNYESVDPVQVLLEMKQVFQWKIEEKGLLLEQDVDPSLPERVLLDPLKVRQILLNLVGNAVKFTHNGKIQLRVSRGVSKSNSDRMTLMYAVHDTGVGIPETQLGDIFDSFSQAQPGNSQYEGTGLGLAISKRLTEMMGGRIWVNSEENTGTSFWVTFYDVKAAESRSVEGDRVKAKPVFKPATIFIVDDVKSNRDLLGVFLKPFEFQIHEAETGEQAIEQAAAIRPDLILMDMKMPGIGGLETVSKIHSEIDSTIPIIAVTAQIDEFNEEKCLNAGCDAVLSKPVGHDELIRLLMQYFDHKHDTSEEGIARAGGKTVIGSNALSEKYKGICCSKDSFAVLEAEGYLARYQTISTGYLLDDIEKFARDVENRFAQMNEDFLVQWAQKLASQVKKLDFEALPETLNEFQLMMDNLKNIS